MFIFVPGEVVYFQITNVQISIQDQIDNIYIYKNIR